MIRNLFFVLLALVPFALFADARFVEAPAECHFPYDNNNVGNEYKVQSCSGVIQTYPDGTRATAAVTIEQKKVSGSLFILDGKDVRDQEAYPNGTLTVTTTGTDSGTNCNIVDAGGTTYQTNNWTGTINVSRTKDKWKVDVVYRLICWAGVAQ